MTETKPSVFTPALQAAQDDLCKYVQSSCFLVVSHDRYWGREKSLEEAARKCSEEGARKASPCSVLLILGDDSAEVNGHGYIVREAGSHNVTVIERVRLGALMQKSKKGGA